jgi:hypothetical protein
LTAAQARNPNTLFRANVIGSDSLHSGTYDGRRLTVNYWC